MLGGSVGPIALLWIIRSFYVQREDLKITRWEVREGRRVALAALETNLDHKRERSRERFPEIYCNIGRWKRSESQEFFIVQLFVHKGIAKSIKLEPISSVHVAKMTRGVTTLIAGHGPDKATVFTITGPPLDGLWFLLRFLDEADSRCALAVEVKSAIPTVAWESLVEIPLEVGITRRLYGIDEINKFGDQFRQLAGAVP